MLDRRGGPLVILRSPDIRANTDVVVRGIIGGGGAQLSADEHNITTTLRHYASEDEAPREDSGCVFSVEHPCESKRTTAGPSVLFGTIHAGRAIDAVQRPEAASL